MALDVTVPPSFERIAIKGGFAGLVAIEMVDGEPWIAGLTPTQAMKPTDLDAVDWTAVAWDAVSNQAFSDIASRKPLDSETAYRQLQAVKQAALEGGRRYNRLNREQLDEVAEAWRQGGPLAVKERFHVSRRQADRYVKRAREAGAL